jgi:hypothetical protein
MPFGGGDVRVSKPLCIDLCCGQKGGWAKGFLAEGYRVIGFDVVYSAEYPGELVIADIRKMALGGAAFRHAAVIVASPPCQEFTRHMLPWCARRNPPPPDLSIIAACKHIAADARVPFVLENVREAQRYIGKACAHYGSRYLWGDVPPILPYAERSRKEHLSSMAVAERSEIPFELASYIARYYKPAVSSVAGGTCNGGVEGV